MAITRRRFRKLSITDALLQAFVGPSVSVVADYGNVIDIEFDDSVTGLEETLDDYMSFVGGEPGSGAKPAFAYATDIDIYVNAGTGNDANPGTITEPVQTLGRALQIVPSEWDGFCNIHLAAGNYSISGQMGTSGIRTDYIGSPVGTNAKPLAWIGEFVAVSAVLTAVAGSSTTQAVVAGPLTPDDYLGATVLVLTGAAAGTRIQVRGNTATDILFINGANNAIGIGDTFRVERPASVVKMDGDVSYWEVFGSLNGTAGMNLKGIKFDLLGNIVDFSGIVVGCTGVEFDHGGGIVYLEDAKLHTQTYYNDPDLQSIDEFFAGIYFNAGGPGTYNLGLFEGSLVYDTCVFNQCAVFVTARSDLSLQSMELVNNSFIYMDGPGNFRHVDGAVRGRARDIVPGAGQTGAVNIYQGCGQAIWGIDFGNITGNAVAIQGGGNASLKDLGNLPATTVSGFGVMVDQMSKAQRISGVAVTGTGGDTSVGGTVKAYGALPFYNANLSAIE
jgi:hypothetical protein